ncbi:hypothetical protein AVEN_228087-1, partial [Araneus ventricosus]
DIEQDQQKNGVRGMQNPEEMVSTSQDFTSDSEKSSTVQ